MSFESSDQPEELKGPGAGPRPPLAAGLSRVSEKTRGQQLHTGVQNSQATSELRASTPEEPRVAGRAGGPRGERTHTGSERNPEGCRSPAHGGGSKLA